MSTPTSFAPRFVVSETGSVHPAAGAARASATGAVPPQLLVDTYSEDFGASFRDAGDALLARVRVTRAVTLTGIGVRNRLILDGHVRFVVFDAGAGALVFASEPQAFDRGPMSVKVSAPFPPVVLHPGVTYAIGGVADVDADWGWERGEDVSGDGVVVSGKANENAAGFDAPALKPARGSVRVHIQLYGSNTPAAFRASRLTPFGL